MEALGNAPDSRGNRVSFFPPAGPRVSSKYLRRVCLKPVYSVLVVLHTTEHGTQ